MPGSNHTCSLKQYTQISDGWDETPAQASLDFLASTQAMTMEQTDRHTETRCTRGTFATEHVQSHTPTLRSLTDRRLRGVGRCLHRRVGDGQLGRIVLVLLCAEAEL